MKETIIKTASGSTLKASGVNTLPSNRKEQINLEEKDILICQYCQEELGKIKPGLDPASIVANHECQKQKEPRLTKIQGLLTSNLRTRTSIDYMAFFRYERACGWDHSLEECQANKCKDCENPVVFRPATKSRPNLKKGDQVILEGKWAKSDGDRPSFTCYSYEFLKGDSK